MQILCNYMQPLLCSVEWVKMIVSFPGKGGGGGGGGDGEYRKMKLPYYLPSLTPAWEEAKRTTNWRVLSLTMFPARCWRGVYC